MSDLLRILNKEGQKAVSELTLWHNTYTDWYSSLNTNKLHTRKPPWKCKTTLLLLFVSASNPREIIKWKENSMCVLDNLKITILFIFILLIFYSYHGVVVNGKWKLRTERQFMIWYRLVNRSWTCGKHPHISSPI